MATVSPTYRTLPMARKGWGGSFIGLPSGLLISHPVGRPPTFPSMSAPLKMPATPGIWLARVVSMVASVVCACGERTNTEDRKSVVKGESEYERVDDGGRGSSNKKN